LKKTTLASHFFVYLTITKYFSLNVLKAAIRVLSKTIESYPTVKNTVKNILLVKELKKNLVKFVVKRPGELKG